MDEKLKREIRALREKAKVYKFTAETVNYYHGLSNKTISIDEL